MSTRRIYKYPLAICDMQEVHTHHRARLLCVDLQVGRPQIWAEVDTTAPTASLSVYVVGTGNPIPDEATTYVDSFQMYEGALVWHVYADAWPS